jgi:hypothetical protein
MFIINLENISTIVVGVCHSLFVDDFEPGQPFMDNTAQVSLLGLSVVGNISATFADTVNTHLCHALAAFEIILWSTKKSETFRRHLLTASQHL